MGGYSAYYNIGIKINKEERDLLDKVCLEYSQHDIFIAGLQWAVSRLEEKNGKKEVSNG